MVAKEEAEAAPSAVAAATDAEKRTASRVVMLMAVIVDNMVYGRILLCI